MSHILADVAFIASQNTFLVVLFVYIATIFIGSAAAFAGFWMALRGYMGSLGLLWILAAVLAADITGDILWYSLGRTLRDTRLGNFIKNRMPHHEKIEAHLQNNYAKWVMISKFLYCSTFPILFGVGWSKIEFKKFFKISIRSILVWVPVLFLLVLGLLSGLEPLRAVSIFRHVEIIFLLGLGLFFVLNYIISLIVRKMFNGEG